MPIKDFTPVKFTIEKTPFKEKLKMIVRRYAYPIYVKLREGKVERKFELKKKYGFDKILLGQKGNDYASHRKNLNRYCQIKDKIILIVGCGTGEDLESWLAYNPKKIIAVDYLNYEKAWKIRKKHLSKKYKTEIVFHQGDAENFDLIGDGTIDIIASDAVYEHLRFFNKVMKELYRVLSKNGVMYATFGPLWYCYGGGHTSDLGSFDKGYNHILLERNDYEKYLQTLGEYDELKPDGRLFHYNDLFSYLTTKQYLDAFNEAGFKKLFSSVMVGEKPIKFKKLYPDKFDLLVKKYGVEDLNIEALSIVYVKK